MAGAPLEWLWGCVKNWGWMCQELGVGCARESDGWGRQSAKNPIPSNAGAGEIDLGGVCQECARI
jgi:hypothetical protein